MTLPGPAPPRLPNAVHAHIFTTQIIPVLLAGAFPDTDPRAIVLTSHPGTPAAALARNIADRVFEHRTVAIFGIEDLLPFHRHYQRGQHPVDPIVAEQAHQWLVASTEYLADIGASFVIENTRADLRVAADVVAALPGTYHIECSFTAHSLAESHLAAIESAQIGYESSGLVDYVGDTNLYECADKLLDVADWAHTSDRVSAVAAYHGRDSTPRLLNTRGRTGWNTLAYRDTAEPDGWALGLSGVSTRRAIEVLRAQPLPLSESRHWLRLFASLRACAHPLLQQPLDDARELARPLLSPAAEQPQSDLRAVTVDRYQVVTVGDLATVATMLQSYPRLTIGVLNLRAPLPPPPNLPADLVVVHDELDRLSAQQYNPLSAAQRTTMWTAALTAARLDDRVSVEVVSDLSEINTRFPTRQFQLAFAAEHDDGAVEAPAARLFAATLRRNVAIVDAPMRYHQPGLPGLWRTDNDAWRRYIPRGALEVFLAADGPTRVLADTAAETTQRITHLGPRPDAATDRITTQLDAVLDHLRDTIAHLPHRDHGSPARTTPAEQHPGHSIGTAVGDIISTDTPRNDPLTLHPPQPPAAPGPDRGPSPQW
ncbi:hypothetical protein [Nocardia niwae]|uniref:hypothetical protein n=1 Tax=Nocardia niwae TaxID=626084 RepID=UPI0034046A0B